MLAEAESLGYWPPRYSMKVTALLNKMNVAKKFAKANDRNYNDRRDGVVLTGLLDDVMDNREEWYNAKLRGSAYTHAMFFGSVSHAPDLLAKSADLAKFAVNDAERAAVATATDWATTVAPVALAIEKLDATKPKPTVRFMKTLSALVLGNVGKAMGLDLTSLKVPDMEWVEVEKVDAKGKPYWTWDVNILWPEGTTHNASKFAYGSCCHACGHRIFNPYNWVPLVAESPDGPKSLWVGSDCAKNLFGCEVKTGETSLRGEVPA